MANYIQLRRLERIIYLLQNYSGLSKRELIERLNEDYDLDFSSRTLERDLSILRTDFGLDVSYNPSTRGYFLFQDEVRINTFFKFVELSSLAEIYQAGLKDFKTFKKWVIPDDSSSYKGVSNIKTILRGVTESRMLQFTKVNYYKEGEREYTVSPLRLKEYLNRWYLIAVPKGEKDIRTFGLDRIINLELLQSSVKLKVSTEKQLKQFEDVVGLNYSSADEVQKIVLRADNRQIKYLRSLPLHHSQVCIDGENLEDWGKVTYKLKPNYEFETQILKLGAMVEVVEPISLREKIKKLITNMSNLYDE